LRIELKCLIVYHESEFCAWLSIYTSNISKLLLWVDFVWKCYFASLSKIISKHDWKLDLRIMYFTSKSFDSVFCWCPWRAIFVYLRPKILSSSDFALEHKLRGTVCQFSLQGSQPPIQKQSLGPRTKRFGLTILTACLIVDDRKLWSRRTLVRTIDIKDWPRDWRQTLIVFAVWWVIKEC